MKNVRVLINPLFMVSSTMNKKMKKRKQLEQQHKRKRKWDT